MPIEHLVEMSSDLSEYIERADEPAHRKKIARRVLLAGETLKAAGDAEGKSAETARIAVSKVLRKAQLLYEIDKGQVDPDLIEHTTLSTRTKNALMARQIVRVSDARKVFASKNGQKEALKWENFGKTTLREVLDYLGLLQDAELERLKDRRRDLQNKIDKVDAEIKKIERCSDA